MDQRLITTLDIYDPIVLSRVNLYNQKLFHYCHYIVNNTTASMLEVVFRGLDLESKEEGSNPGTGATAQ